MLKNYLITAFRNLSKRKLFTFIHIIGLTIAFAVSIILFLTAMFEFSFDDFHERKDRLYQVYFESSQQDGKEQSATLPVPFAPTAQQELKGIEHISRYGDNGGALARVGEKEIGLTSRFIDPSFLSMFSFPLLEGSKSDALNELNNIVLTKDAAMKLFGNQSAIGKQIELNIQGTWEPYLVSGIAKEFPTNSSIRFDAFIRFEKFPGYAGNEDKWNNRNHGAFVELTSKSSKEKFEAESQAFVNKFFKTDIDELKRDGAQALENGAYKSLRLLPLTQAHFSDIGVGSDRVGPLFPWMLLLLSALILFVACTNFINLSLAGSFTRSKEIGMRKTLGALKSQLIFQFWYEALIVCLLSLLLGGFLAWLLLPQFNSLMGYSLVFAGLFTFKNICLLIVCFLILTLIAGGYPALVMACYNTIQVLKGKLKLGSKNGLRNALSIGQFSIAIVLIIATITTIKQINYIQKKPLGYNKAEVISIPIGNNIDPETALERMRLELKSIPMVESVTGTDINMGMGMDGSQSNSKTGFDYKNRKVLTNWLRIDYDYLQTLQIELLEGRDFSRDFSSDIASVLINEQMAALLGEKDPIGKILPLADNENVKIIGVVKDFNFQTLHTKVEPLTMSIYPAEPLSYIFVRIKSEDLSQAMAVIEKTWKTVNPKASVAASFLDENTQRLYKNEKKFSRIIISGSVLAILISCMGLFALALLMMNQRTKEIGVRKVLGARVSEIVLLLSKDFIRLIGIAFLIGAPLAWWFMNSWLEGFAYRIQMNVWVLFLGGIIVLVVALLTVMTQSFRAAVADPVKSLRTE